MDPDSSRRWNTRLTIGNIPPAPRRRSSRRASPRNPRSRQRRQHRPRKGSPALKTKSLDRVISKAGLGSRTQARSWIHAGRVRVNGRVVENPDQWIDFERDKILFDDKPLQSKNRVYILLYKPT